MISIAESRINDWNATPRTKQPLKLFRHIPDGTRTAIELAYTFQLDRKAIPR